MRTFEICLSRMDPVNHAADVAELCVIFSTDEPTELDRMCCILGMGYLHDLGFTWTDDGDTTLIGVSDAETSEVVAYWSTANGYELIEWPAARETPSS